jgi:hypothetical protein
VNTEFNLLMAFVFICLLLSEIYYRSPPIFQIALVLCICCFLLGPMLGLIGAYPGAAFDRTYSLVRVWLTVIVGGMSLVGLSPRFRRR